jgi:hypothetical protein
MPTSSEWEGYYYTILVGINFVIFFQKTFGTKLGNSVFPLYIISKILLEKFDKFST